MDRYLSRSLLIAALLLVQLVQPPAAGAAGAAQPTTAPCYQAAIAALTKQGAAYQWGAKGPTRFDCSGLVWWAYAQAGVSIGQSTFDQVNNGTAIACRLSHLNGSATTCWALGDLIFLRDGSNQHVAIYVGNGLFMDCYNQAVGCILHDVRFDDYYQAHYWQSRRIVSGCASTDSLPSLPSPNLPDGLPTGDPLTAESPLLADLPALDTLPALLSPIALALPWQCDMPPPGLRLQHEPAVEWYDLGSWFPWLAVQIWNRAALPATCWGLASAQAILNAIALAINDVVLLGINNAWRLVLLVTMFVRNLVLYAVAAFDWMRAMLWSFYGQLVTAILWVASFGQVAQDMINLVADILAQLGALIMGAASALAYAVGIFLAVIPGLVTAVTTPTAPEQLTGISSNILFVMVRDTIQAVVDSRIGWAWYAFAALFYLRFGMWFIGQMSELNA